MGVMGTRETTQCLGDIMGQGRMKKEMSKMSRESKWAMKENMNTLHSMVIKKKTGALRKTVSTE